MKWFFPIFFGVCFLFLTIFGIGCVYGTLFPIKFQEEITLASEKTGLDEAVIYATINVESRFRKNAVSSKGAIGLMQLLPTTADEVAKNLGVTEYDLFDPQNNILLGSQYLASLLQKFENVDVAMAAYNAGPTNVKAWLANKEYSQDGKTLTKIPFAETRDYVARFSKNLKYYKSKTK